MAQIALRYRAQIDGLRGVAVGLVIACHVLPGLPTGRVGVDIFFVISGYLITTILLAEHRETGRVDIRRFYIRRMWRLYPALTVALLLIAVAGSLFKVISPSPKPLMITIMAGLTYTTNFLAASEDAGDVGLLPIGNHFWSLGQEEQFYLIWPVLLVVVLRSPRWRLFTSAVLASLWLSSLFALALTHGTRFAEFSPAVRSGGLVLGALLALRNDSGRGMLSIPRWLLWAAILGLTASLVMPLLVPAVYGFEFPVAAVSSVVFVAHCLARPEGDLSRILSLQPLVRLGRISYSLYLFHVPILFILYFAFGLGAVTSIVAGLVVSLIVSSTSWKFLEERFRKSNPAVRSVTYRAEEVDVARATG